MNYDKKNLVVRRYEVQVHHHAAYLYWNLEGVIAEKWGHGPHFGAYQKQAHQVQLTVRAGETSPLVGVYGLKGSAFIAERDYSLKEAQGLATEWMTDVLKVLEPKRVNRMWVRIFYGYPVDDPSKVSDSIRDLYPSVDDFAPKNLGDATHPGLSFQYESQSNGEQTKATCAFGIFSYSDAREALSLWEDGEWSLGLNYYRHVQAEAGFSDPAQSLTALLDGAKSESQLLLSGNLMKTINNA